MAQAPDDQATPRGPELPGGYLSTLGKGLGVLVHLENGPLSSVAIATDLGLDRTGAHRILKTLEHHGFVARTAQNKYQLGIRIWELGTSAFEEREFLTFAAERAKDLMLKTEDTAHVAVYNEGYAVYVAKHDGTAAIVRYTKLGGRAPAHCVATGKALLACQPETEIRRLVAEGLTTFTPHTIGDERRLRNELVEIRRQRFAVNLGEWRSDAGGVASAILGTDGRAVAAIGLSGPVDRISERLEQYAELVRTAAQDVADQMNGVRPADS